MRRTRMLSALNASGRVAVVLNSDGHLAVANHFNVYEAIRFAAASKAIRATVKAHVEERFREALLVKNATISLATGLQQRLAELYRVPSTVHFGFVPLLCNGPSDVGTWNIGHEVKLRDNTNSTLASFLFRTHSRTLDADLDVIVYPGNELRLSRFTCVNFVAEPRTEGEGVVTISGTESAYTGGLLAFLVDSLLI